MLFESVTEPLGMNGSAETYYRVFLSATNEKALDKVSMDELKKFAAKEG